MKRLTRFVSLLLIILCGQVGFAQGLIKGVVVDGTSGDPIIFGNVIIKGTTTGVTTDYDGKFEIEVASFPVTLEFSYISYIAQVKTFSAPSSNITIRLKEDNVMLSEAQIVGQRISDKQKQASLTVESMDVIAIKEAPSGSFYESLGTLKGVDITSASLGFKIINTRGFNSTSPVRSLQLIDGVDNQSPGLNFSLGNFLGASDLDVMRVDIIAGASSAFFGPGAFNGVINMTTKDPFTFPGFSMYMKRGERGLWEYAFRLAQVIKNDKGEEKFGFKLNWFSLQANEWEAENYDPITGSQHDETNPYGYDAVNVYGDEATATNNDVTDIPQDYAGLGTFYRRGYKESELVNYDTDNRKFNTGLYFNINSKVQVSYNFNYSTGSTVYQGDNRYALKNVEFMQHKLQIGEKDNWFVRLYSTQEDAGDTYDIVTTGIRMLEESANTAEWNTRMAQYWRQNFTDDVKELARYDELFTIASEADIPNAEKLDYFRSLLSDWYGEEFDYFSGLYDQALDGVNTQSTAVIEPFFEPGTARFDSLRAAVTSKTFTDGGSLFYDRSSLYNVQAEKKFEIDFLDIVGGVSSRLYTPDTQGTIFQDTLTYVYALDSVGNYILDSQGRRVTTDSSRVVIRNWEVGAYVGLEAKFFEDKLKVNTTGRVDKNENFDFLPSFAASLVFVPSESHTLRASVSSAIRNPTLADQYLFYNVGRAILLGNVDGRFEAGSDSLITIDSFNEYRSSTSLIGGLEKLEYFNLDRIRPEKVRTIEAGYRGTLGKKVYLDVGAYFSEYTDFIGYVIGLTSDFDESNGFTVGEVGVFRIAANAQGKVRTTGGAIGLNYYFKRMMFNANYSYNTLLSGDDDPIIPAFNTPKHKYNLGLSGRDLVLFNKIKKFGFGINYKWVDGFVFEGSPQFTGPIDGYDMVDAQINVFVPQINCTVKLGGSNIFGVIPFFDKDLTTFSDKFEKAIRNDNLQVYGGPLIGRLLYASVLFELK
ncbi:MAG: iron complex outermembrane receptor protein [Litorivivens sp.]|jgi:iron complex outermembrane receptor protein